MNAAIKTKGWRTGRFPGRTRAVIGPRCKEEWEQSTWPNYRKFAMMMMECSKARGGFERMIFFKNILVSSEEREKVVF